MGWQKDMTTTCHNLKFPPSLPLQSYSYFLLLYLPPFLNSTILLNYHLTRSFLSLPNFRNGWSTPATYIAGPPGHIPVLSGLSEDPAKSFSECSILPFSVSGCHSCIFFSPLLTLKQPLTPVQLTFGQPQA